MYTLFKKLKGLYSLACFVLLGVWHFLHALGSQIPLKKIKEHSAFFTVVILYLLSDRVLRWIDPTAGTFDVGVLQVIGLALVKYATFLFVTWSSYQVIWPDLGHFMKFYFKDTFLQLTPWQKILLSCSIYFFLLFTLVLLSNLGI